MVKDSPTKPAEKGIEITDLAPSISKKFASKNTQSQTLRENSVQDEFEYSRLRELEDSDNEDDYRASRKKEKEPARDKFKLPVRDKLKSRRYTIESEEYEDEFVLSKNAEIIEDEVEDSETLFEKI